MSFDNQNKKSNLSRGSVAFVFYFIIALALLAVAGYYIGINEQQRLFKTIVEKKQEQEDRILNGAPENTNDNVVATSENPDVPIKSLIDSPLVVLRNIRNSNNSVNRASNGISSTSANGLGIETGPNVDLNSSSTIDILNVAKSAKYFIKTNEKKNGTEITLLNGEVKGDSCYNSPTERLCFPYYKLEKIWSTGDLNGDGVSDAVITVSATESILGKQVKVNNFYAILDNLATTSKSTSTSTSTIASKSTSTPISTQTSILTYSVVPFEFASSTPIISSAEIEDGLVVLLGNFYANNDVVGSPSLKKVVKYKVDSISAQKVSEARLFAEQGDKTSTWYQYNYFFDGLDFSFKIPETWRTEENFDKGVKLAFKTSDARTLVLDTNSIVETCSEYNFNLKDATNVDIKGSEFIDLGLFGVGSYIKYTINFEGMNEYVADICVTDKNNDKKVFSLHSTTKEDGVPYFAIFDKIWSTFKVMQK